MTCNSLKSRSIRATASALLVFLSIILPAKLIAAEWVLNGIALHQELNTDYFLAGLYLPVSSNDANEILAMKGQKRMEMRVTFDNFSPRKFAGLWRDSIVINNSPADVDKYGPDMLRFASVMKGKLVRGDQVVIDQLPAATVVSVNNIELARFSPDFFPLLLRTWIGPRPASSDFKKDVLSKGKIKDEFQTRYNTLVPLDGRKQLATLWASGSPGSDVDNSAAIKAAEESRLQAEAEAAKARAEAEAQAKAEAQARAEAEAKAQAEAKARAEAQAKLKAEAQARAEAENKAHAEALAAAKAAEEATKNASDAAAKAVAEAKTKAAAEARQHAEAEAKARAQAEAQAKLEEEARVLAEAKAAAEAQARAEEAAKAKAEAEARALAAAKAEEEAKKRAAEAAAKQQVAVAAPAAGAASKPAAADEDNAAVVFDAKQVSRELYKSKLVAWVYKSLEYPEKDKHARKEGSLQVKVVISRDGKLISTDLIEETRYATLNIAAKNATKLAQPYPNMPKDIEGDTFEFIVPILFRAD